MTARESLALVTMAAASLLAGCATLGALGQIVQPLRIESDRERPAELRLGGGGLGLPTSATVRLWARVTNPNPFGLTLSTIDGAFFLEDARAAAVRFPLGLPLAPGREEVIPLDVSLRFADLSGLGGALGRLVRGDPMGYRLEGSFSVDAGRLGTPFFGPMTLLTGEVRAR